MDKSYDFFFFFQAEDGIRDVAVTGVQTCALPISARHREVHPQDGGARRRAAGARCVPGRAEAPRGDAASRPAGAAAPAATRAAAAVRRPRPLAAAPTARTKAAGAKAG